MSLLGKNIIALRERKGLTQEKLAKLVGISKGNMSRIERDLSWFSRPVAEKLANVLGVGVSGLFADPTEASFQYQGYRLVPVYPPDMITWNNSDPRPQPDDRYESVMVQMQQTGQVFAMRMPDESMMPEFRRDDLLVINPSGKPMPGDFVAADSEETGLLFRQYRVKSVGRGGKRIFELHPLSPHYPIVSEETLDVRLLGTLVEVRRMLL